MNEKEKFDFNKLPGIIRFLFGALTIFALIFSFLFLNKYKYQQVEDFFRDIIDE